MNSKLDHCLCKISELVAKGDGGRRSVSQLGYNLGRLSEMANLGREPCWDNWKEAILEWDRPQLVRLSVDVRERVRRLDQVNPERLESPTPH